MSEREEYLREMEEMLLNLQTMIAEYAQKAAAAGDEFSEAAKDKLADLQETQRDARATFERLRGQTGEAWTELKRSLDQAASQLDEGIRKARHAFRSPSRPA